MCIRQRHPVPRSAAVPAAASALRITALDLPGRARVLRLDGEIDMDQRRELEDALADAPPRLVVDLSRLGFCDSTGLNALIKTRQAAADSGTGLLLVAPVPQVRRLLEAAGADALFTVAARVTAALAGDGHPTGR
ncbi:STAS domain-containing protein [Kitasatospora sp. NPDC086801]|uniref:STAS domain-containing protein n=1 Tax=Kitasatospora sp. NPDC086801 TaxID=3364066 RepID=UPI00382DF37A